MLGQVHQEFLMIQYGVAAAVSKPTMSTAWSSSLCEHFALDGAATPFLYSCISSAQTPIVT